MKAELLAAAKTNQKQQRWQRAVEYYERYFTDNSADAADIAYIGYARCLRQTGALSQAVDLLRRARRAYPGHEKILRELFVTYDSQSDWVSAQHVADSLIEFFPTNPQHYFRAGKAHSWQGNPSQATAVYQQGLALTHGAPFHTIIHHIEQHLSSTEGSIRSEYRYVGGTHNLGAIVHEVGSHAYLTKISTNTRGARREQTFYKDVLPSLQGAGVIAPKYVHSQIIDGVVYITVEMLDKIDGLPELHEVIDLAQRIASLKDQNIGLTHPNPPTGPWLRRPTTLVHKFSDIHTEQQNRDLLARAQELAQLQSDPEAAQAVVSRVTDLILGYKLYTFIDPHAHYGVIHGDFVKPNMGRDHQDGTVKAFDWAGFRVGPHFLNIVHYTAISWTPYDKIAAAYLFNRDAEGLSTIEQIFFLYAYILMQINRESSASFSDRLNFFIYPALADLEKCVTRFKNAEFSHLIQHRTDTRVALSRLDDQVRHLEQLLERHSDLEEQLKITQKDLHDVLNSRTWKATAPPRALLGKLKRVRTRLLRAT